MSEREAAMSYHPSATVLNVAEENGSLKFVVVQGSLTNTETSEQVPETTAVRMHRKPGYLGSHYVSVERSGKTAHFYLEEYQKHNDIYAWTEFGAHIYGRSLKHMSVASGLDERILRNYDSSVFGKYPEMFAAYSYGTEYYCLEAQLFQPGDIVTIYF